MLVVQDCDARLLSQTVLPTQAAKKLHHFKCLPWPSCVIEPVSHDPHLLCVQSQYISGTFVMTN